MGAPDRRGRHRLTTAVPARHLAGPAPGRLSRLGALVAVAMLAAPEAAALFGGHASAIAAVGAAAGRAAERPGPVAGLSPAPRRAGERQASGSSAAAPRRIVSVVPAVTEMLFAMGAGDRVVGVSSFDTHPAEVKGLAKVGALLDPDVERILALRPDLVVTYASQADLVSQMRRAGVATFDYRHGGLADVPATIRALGRRLETTGTAEALAGAIEQRVAAVRGAVLGRPRPRALLVFGREPLALRNVYASGGVGFLHDMLLAAGADNVFGDVGRESVQATSELILARAPDVIVELRYGRTLTPDEVRRERETWGLLPGVPAVARSRVVVLVGDEFVVPGPRVADALERLARALHPESPGALVR